MIIKPRSTRFDAADDVRNRFGQQLGQDSDALLGPPPLGFEKNVTGLSRGCAELVKRAPLHPGLA